MDGIPVADAAQRLSLSPVAAYEALRSGRLVQVPRSSPARVTLASVQRLAADRRTEALRRRSDPAALARHVDGLLNPGPGPVGGSPAPGYGISLLPSGREALKTLPPDAFAIFGRDVLEAAASRDRLRKSGGCPTCWAYMSAHVHQTFEPQDGEAYRVLLGEPCPADRSRWAAETEIRRREAARLHRTETARRAEAERARTAQAFSAARREAEAAVSRLRTATTAMAAIDPAIVRLAGAQARRSAEEERRRAERRSALDCTCDATRQCTRHATLDAQARPFRRRR